MKRMQRLLRTGSEEEVERGVGGDRWWHKGSRDARTFRPVDTVCPGVQPWPNWLIARKTVFAELRQIAFGVTDRKMHHHQHER